MNVNTYAPWEHYPKTLSQQEITEPIIVITDFFVAGGVKSHKRKLKEWRNFVTSDTYYSDEKHGPGDLLFTYDLNLKLLEATYLLWVDHQNSNWNYQDISDAQIQEEKDTWEYYPKNLKPKEQTNPYLAIKKVFKKISPQQYREYLREWLYFALYNSPADEELTAGEIMLVYENLLKLYSAAWLIYQRTNESDSANNYSLAKKEELPAVKISGIAPRSTTAEALGLEEIKKLILECFPSVKLIIHLGTHPEPYTFYLLILVDDDYKTPEHSISNKIEDNCRYLANVIALVHKEGSGKNALKYGSRFWQNAVSNGNTLYQSLQLALPKVQEGNEEENINNAQYNWERWGVQGQEFLKGAAFYYA